MFRRSRFSVRPNVSTVGRTAAGTSQEPPSANQEASEMPKEVKEGNDAATVTDKSDVTPSENISASGDGNDQNGEGTSSSASVQRRKRFYIKPKVAPGRPPTLSRTPKSPIKAASAAPPDVSGSDTEKPSTSSKAATTAAPRGLQSPRRRRLSEDSKQLKVQPKLTPVPSETVTITPAEDVCKQAENITDSQVKEVTPRPPERVPPSLPDKETTEISEKAKTLISSKNVLSMTPSALSLSRLLNDPSDVQRLMKAQKLRELLKRERCKEKKLKKAKARPKEFTLDPTKMTMRDLIHYLPLSNPMTSSLEDTAQEDETVIPPSPSQRREKSPEKAQQAEVLPVRTSVGEEEEEGDAAAEEEQDEALMVPQVKVAEDGSLIIDEESLTVEVQRAKGPNPAQDREPIFERGSTTTYSSFRKANYTKPWSIEETDMFFLAVSMVGTDFSMICQLFPHRARLEIKNKFKKEERENSWRIDKAFRERRKLDIEYFSKLLEKVLEVQKDKKKLKSLAGKNTTKKLKTKAKRKKAAKKLSDVEEEDEDQILELEDGGEKENEDQCNEGGVPASEPKKKCKRKKNTKNLPEEPNEKKTKTGEAGVPENSEAALPEDQTNSDMPEEDVVTKPAKLSRGRAPKPLLPLASKRGKKLHSATKDKEATSEKGEESVSGEASKEQMNEEISDLSCANKRKSASDEISSEEDEAAVKAQGPTRYGRVPKPIQPLTYPSKEDPHSSESETTPAKSKCSVKRGKSSMLQSAQKLKKPKLVTIRSSKSDFSDEESENELEDRRMEDEQHFGCSSSRDAEASMFVPSSLHPSNVVVSEVDETMVELDILDSMPDVLGISQDALCPDSSCQKAQHETGTAEPCEHQLDLLVDVIDFLSSEHTEGSSDESYNEAAQTLLTIGNLTHVSQSTQGEMTTQDCTKEKTADGVIASNHPEEDIVSSSLEQSSTDLLCPTFDQEVIETSQTVCIVELQSSEKDNDDLPHIESSHQTCVELKAVCDTDPIPQLTSNSESSNKTSSVMKTRCFSKVKPKPKLVQTSITAKPTSQKKTPEEQKTEEHMVNETTAKEVTLERTDSVPALLESNISSTEVKSSEETSVEPFITQTCSLSASQFEPSRNQSTTDTRTSDSTDESLLPHGETDTAETSNSAVAESQQDSSTLSDPFQNSSDKHPPCTLPAEDLPVSQKGDGEVATSSQPKGNRLPKIKPKPNLTRTSRAVRNKSQVSEETVEKDSLSALKPECLKQTETSSLSFKHTKKVKTYGEVANKAASDVMTSEQNAMENQNNSKVQLTGDQTTISPRLTSEFTEENLMSQVGTTYPTVPESQVPQESNVNLAATQEQSDNPVTLLAPVKERTVNEEENNVALTCQSKRSRTQKIKPKPNVPQTSRAARSKPQTTEEPAEKDSSPGPSDDFPEKKILEVEQKSTCTAFSDKQTESSDSASGLKPALTSGSSVTPSEENQTNVGLDQIHMGAASDPSAIENQNFSDLQSKQVKKQTTNDTGFNSEVTATTLIPSDETSEGSCNYTVDSGGVKSQVSLESYLDSAPVHEQSDLSTFVRPVEESKVCEQDFKIASASQLRSRLPKIKPKPNVPQRPSKFKHQTSEEPTGKHSASSPNLESNKKTMAKVEPDPTCNIQPEKQNQELPKVQLEASGEQLTRDEDKSSEFKDANLSSHVGRNENRCDNVALANQAVTQTQVGKESNPTSERSGQPAASEELLSQEKGEVASSCQLRKSRLQKIKPKPNLPQISRTSRFKPKVAKDSSCSPTPDKKSAAGVETQPLLPDKQIENTDVGHDSEVDLGTLPSDQSASKNQNLYEVQPEQSSEQDTYEMKKSSEFKDANLTSYVGTSDLGFRKSQIGKESSVGSASVRDQSEHLPPVVISVERLPVSKQKDKAAYSPEVVNSKPELLQDHVTVMQHLDKSQSPTLSSKSLDKTKAEEAEPTCSTWLPDKLKQNKSADFSPVSGRSLESAHKCTEKSSSFKEQMMPNVGQVVSSEGTKQTISQRSQRFPKVKPKPNLGLSSKSTCRKLQSDDSSKPLEEQLMDSSSTVTEQQPEESAKSKMSKDDGVETDLALSGDGKVEMSNTQTVTDQTGIQDIHSTRKQTTSNTDFTSHESDSSGQSSDQMSSELTESKAPQVRRGRLIKPKPNLQLSSCPQQSQQVKNTKPTKADSSSCSQGVDASVDPKSVSEVGPDSQEPIKGIVDKLSHKDSSSNDAHSSLSCVTQPSTTQNESTPSAEGIPSYPLIPEVLPAEVPSDPDEPFFILSLTAIPVSSAGEGETISSEHLSDLPVTDSSVHQPSVSLEVAGDGFVSTKESSVVINVDAGREPTSSQSDQQGRETTAVQLLKFPEIMESNEIETPPSKQTLKGSGRKGKLQVKSKSSKKKQTSSAVTETESASSQSGTIQDSDNPEPSEQPKSSGNIITDSLTGGKVAVPTVASQTAQSIRHQSKKAKEFPSFFSGTSSSSESKPPSRIMTAKRLKTPSAVAKKSSSEPEASTSKDVSTLRPSQPCLTSVTPPDVDIALTSTHRLRSSHSAPSSHLRTAEASTNDDISEAALVEEEPTNVLQYFLSDIFTEVEEG
ncbi:transcription factor TFIIIB component B'' homolog isoform X2 [Kryptolebias marmoratus]|uniref:transcription factor TFIIIB component B'' homolog isoform X2 n=1 Tax=Kryptolebias marmoratus TaxID=37003 RepID=UPI0007F8E52D|nr:transcription factor TFIIIB component B'' homolog isoform X2 [Kryptolebias marmoratus]